MTRAKFKCLSVKTTEYSKEYEFAPVINGSPENDEFFKTTPSGKLVLNVNNAGVNFVVGLEYYLDFNEVANDA